MYKTYYNILYFIKEVFCNNKFIKNYVHVFLLNYGNNNVVINYTFLLMINKVLYN